MTQEVNAPNYSQWQNHFKDMAQGKLKPSNIMIVNKSQEGSGSSIQLVSPAEQIDAMARAKVQTIEEQKRKPTKAIKRKVSHSTSHSVSKRRKTKVVKRKR